MKRQVIALVCGLGLSLSLGVSADEAPTSSLPRSLQAFAKACESKGAVSAAAFERQLKSAAKKRPGWVVAVQSEDAAVRAAYAKQLADSVNATVHLVSASSIVGKYIGETEKNLALLFERAEQGNWLLFFDEADALFGKRTEVRDSHDRYASEHASTIPDRLLEYKGLLVLGARATRFEEAAVTRKLADTFVVTSARDDRLIPTLPWQTVCRAPATPPPPRGEPSAKKD